MNGFGFIHRSRQIVSRVALYGGSFDPFHLCHQLVISYTLSLADIDKLIVAPCHTHPFNKKMAPFDDRLNMVNLGVRRCMDVEVSAIEKDIASKNGTNFTYFLVENLLKEYDTIILVLGSDVSRDLNKWKYFDELKTLEKNGRLEFFFVNRNGYTIDNGSRVQMPSISSTEIRAAIKAGNSIKEYVPLEVEKYIKQNKMYID